jgi:hypothetical protein
MQTKILSELVMETFFVWVVSLGAGFFMCLLLMALFTLLVRRRTRQVKRLNSRQVSWVPSSLLVKRNKWLMVQHERRQNLDLTSSCPQTSQSLGSLACPYTNTGRSSSQNDDNYSTRNGMGIGFGNQDNMGLWVKEEPPSSSSLSLCRYSDASSSLTLTIAATSCTTLPPTPNTSFFTPVRPFAV